MCVRQAWQSPQSNPRLLSRAGYSLRWCTRRQHPNSVTVYCCEALSCQPAGFGLLVLFALLPWLVNFRSVQPLALRPFSPTGADQTTDVVQIHLWGWRSTQVGYNKQIWRRITSHKYLWGKITLKHLCQEWGLATHDLCSQRRKHGEDDEKGKKSGKGEEGDGGYEKKETFLNKP